MGNLESYSPTWNEQFLFVGLLLLLLEAVQYTPNPLQTLRALYHRTLKGTLTRDPSLILKAPLSKGGQEVRSRLHGALAFTGGFRIWKRTLQKAS